MMATAYELWDFDTRNIVAVYDSQEAALAAVRDDLQEHGRELVETLVLLVTREDGAKVRIAAGDDLIARAEAVARPARGAAGA
jgi:hypothetical protein